MSRKPVIPELVYQYEDTEENKRAVNDVFFFLFDQFFSERSSEMEK